ncbi:MAG TPA: NAD(P)-dependent oxidoreductase, partial [Candidatus Saccharimonadales bacterium]|nr:NAD(P)-dependent oxidoreductase [Candidatus Saccharimonadales bacterium]
SGAIGRRLLPQLVARGHEVTGTTRDPANVEVIAALGARPMVVDGLDATAVGEAVARARPDAIIHEMTALSGPSDFRRFDRWFATTNRLRTEGTRHLLAAAQAAGAERFLAQSYTGWNNRRDRGPVVTEEDPLDPDVLPGQRETFAAIEALEAAVTGAPLDGIILRYGALYGPGASEPLIELFRQRKLPIMGRGDGVWSNVHVDDAAAATVAALERGRAGTYNVVDDEPVRVAEFLPAVAALVGAKPPLRIPVWLGRVLAGDVAVRILAEVRGASNHKAKRDLGWQPIWPDWRDGFRNGLDVPVPDPGTTVSATAGRRSIA